MSGYSELAAIAASLGLPLDGEPQIQFVRGGSSVTVSLDLNSGTVVGINVHLARRGLPDLVLRRETDADGRSKARGIDVEAQTGDAAFDRQVYVETDLPEDAVRTLLASADARGAIVVVLGACERIALSSLGIDASTRAHADLRRPERFHAVLDALLTLAALPAIHVAPDALVPRRGGVILALSIAAFPLSVGATIVGFAVWTPMQATLPLFSVGAGAVLWLVAWALIARRVRGYSTASRDAVVLVLLQLFIWPLLTCGLAVGANGAFDRADAERRVGAVVSVRHYTNDDDALTDAVTRWPDGTTTELTFDDANGQIAPGNPVVQTWRRGALGFAWGLGATANSNTGGKVP